MDALARQTQDRIGVIEELLNERYSVRAFLSQPVPRDTIDRLLIAAQRTASWCNSQPWQVIIASGEAARIAPVVAVGGKAVHIVRADAGVLAGRDHGHQRQLELGVGRLTHIFYAHGRVCAMRASSLRVKRTEGAAASTGDRQAHRSDRPILAVRRSA